MGADNISGVPKLLGDGSFCVINTTIDTKRRRWEAPRYDQYRYTKNLEHAER